MTSDNAKSMTKLTRSQIHAVFSRLLVVCKKAPGGMAVYDDNHTDHTIAVEFNISHNQVASCRTEAVGLLTINNAGKANTKARLEILEARLLALETKFSTWEDEDSPPLS